MTQSYRFLPVAQRTLGQVEPSALPDELEKERLEYLALTEYKPAASLKEVETSYSCTRLMTAHKLRRAKVEQIYKQPFQIEAKSCTTELKCMNKLLRILPYDLQYAISILVRLTWPQVAENKDETLEWTFHPNYLFELQGLLKEPDADAQIWKEGSIPSFLQAVQTILGLYRGFQRFTWKRAFPTKARLQQPAYAFAFQLPHVMHVAYGTAENDPETQFLLIGEYHSRDPEMTSFYRDNAVPFQSVLLTILREQPEKEFNVFVEAPISATLIQGRSGDWLSPISMAQWWFDCLFTLDSASATFACNLKNANVYAVDSRQFRCRLSEDLLISHVVAAVDSWEDVKWIWDFLRKNNADMTTGDMTKWIRLEALFSPMIQSEWNELHKGKVGSKQKLLEEIDLIIQTSRSNGAIEDTDLTRLMAPDEKDREEQWKKNNSEWRNYFASWSAVYMDIYFSLLYRRVSRGRINIVVAGAAHTRSYEALWRKQGFHVHTSWNSDIGDPLPVASLAAFWEPKSTPPAEESGEWTNKKLIQHLLPIAQLKDSGTDPTAVFMKVLRTTRTDVFYTISKMACEAALSRWTTDPVGPSIYIEQDMKIPPTTTFREDYKTWASATIAAQQVDWKEFSRNWRSYLWSLLQELNASYPNFGNNLRSAFPNVCNHYLDLLSHVPGIGKYTISTFQITYIGVSRYTSLPQDGISFASLLLSYCLSFPSSSLDILYLPSSHTETKSQRMGPWGLIEALPVLQRKVSNLSSRNLETDKHQLLKRMRQLREATPPSWPQDWSLKDVPFLIGAELGFRRGDSFNKIVDSWAKDTVYYQTDSTADVRELLEELQTFYCGLIILIHFLQMPPHSPPVMLFADEAAVKLLITNRFDMSNITLGEGFASWFTSQRGASSPQCTALRRSVGFATTATWRVPDLKTEFDRKLNLKPVASKITNFLSAKAKTENALELTKSIARSLIVYTDADHEALVKDPKSALKPWDASAIVLSQTNYLLARKENKDEKTVTWVPDFQQLYKARPIHLFSVGGYNFKVDKSVKKVEAFFAEATTRITRTWLMLLQVAQSKDLDHLIVPAVGQWEFLYGEKAAIKIKMREIYRSTLRQASETLKSTSGKKLPVIITPMEVNNYDPSLFVAAPKKDLIAIALVLLDHPWNRVGFVVPSSLEPLYGLKALGTDFSSSDMASDLFKFEEFLSLLTLASLVDRKRFAQLNLPDPWLSPVVLDTKGL